MGDGRRRIIEMSWAVRDKRPAGLGHLKYTRVSMLCSPNRLMHTPESLSRPSKQTQTECCIPTSRQVEAAPQVHHFLDHAVLPVGDQ